MNPNRNEVAKKIKKLFSIQSPERLRANQKNKNKKNFSR